MKKDNIINIDLSSLVDYLRDKDIEIEHLSYQLNNYKRICEDYERVIDKIKEKVNEEEFTMKQKYEMREDILELLEEIE